MVFQIDFDRFGNGGSNRRDIECVHLRAQIDQQFTEVFRRYAAAELGLHAVLGSRPVAGAVECQRAAAQAQFCQMEPPGSAF